MDGKIKCPHCGSISYASRKEYDKAVIFRCKECKGDIQVEFFDACPRCHEIVGFSDNGLFRNYRTSNFLLDVGKNAIKMLSNPEQGIMNSIDMLEAVDANGTGACPECNSLYIRCPKCNELTEIPQSTKASDVKACIKCNQLIIPQQLQDNMGHCHSRLFNELKKELSETETSDPEELSQYEEEDNTGYDEYNEWSYDEILSKVIEIIAQELDIDAGEITEEISVLDLHPDQTDIRNIGYELGEEFEIEFPDDSLNNLTIREIADGIFDSLENQWETFYFGPERDSNNDEQEITEHIKSHIEYEALRQYDQVATYVKMLLFSLESEKEILNTISKEIHVEIQPYEIKGNNPFGNKIIDLVCERVDPSINIANLISAKYLNPKVHSHFIENLKSNDEIEIFSLGEVEDKGSFVSGLVLSGNFKVGDKVVLFDAENDDEYVGICEITWIELFDQPLNETVAGDTPGIGLRGKLPEPNDFFHGRIERINSYEEHLKEEEYKKEYLEIVKSGEVTPNERRLLDKLAKSLGLSDGYIRRLEEMAKAPSFSGKEKEYEEEIKICLENDGVISERERHLLNRLAKSLEISPNRAEEIEKIVIIQNKQN